MLQKSCINIQIRHYITSHEEKEKIRENPNKIEEYGIGIIESSSIVCYNKRGCLGRPMCKLS